MRKAGKSRPKIKTTEEADAQFLDMVGQRTIDTLEVVRKADAEREKDNPDNNGNNGRNA